MPTTSLAKTMASEHSFVIELSNVSLIRDEQVILKDISWKVKRGEHWAVLGANGSGKTMMLKIVNGYLWPSEGTVSVLGNQFGTVDLRKLRQSIGWVSSALQENVPRGEKSIEVVLSGKYASLGLWDNYDAEDQGRALGLLRLMGCEEASTRSFGVLSQGEQQRVLIARALMPKPALLILDEPCVGLDPNARENVLETVQRLSLQRDEPTLILVTHHTEEIIPAFSNVLVLRSGRVLAQGSKQEVLTEAIMSEAFGRPLEISEKNGRFWVRMKNS
jgi:iron complex transport system ATP-binding protein